MADVARIVGYIVFSGPLDSAALYNLSSREEAYDAARRWGACISAVVMHPAAPEVTGTPVCTWCDFCERMVDSACSSRDEAKENACPTPVAKLVAETMPKSQEKSR